MDLNPTPQEQQFREELRAWLKANEPPIGWLILSGLTEQAFFEVTTLAMAAPYSAAWRTGTGCAARISATRPAQAPQPQPPVAFGLLKVKPEPITLLT